MAHQGTFAVCILSCCTQVGGCRVQFTSSSDFKLASRQVARLPVTVRLQQTEVCSW